MDMSIHCCTTLKIEGRRPPRNHVGLVTLQIPQAPGIETCPLSFFLATYAVQTRAARVPSLHIGSHPEVRGSSSFPASNRAVIVVGKTLAFLACSGLLPPLNPLTAVPTR